MPDGILSRLRPKQLSGVRWLAQRFRHDRALGLLDDPGLGKTLQALALIDLLDLKRILVVSPAGARRVWKTQIDQWFPNWTPRVTNVEPGAHYGPNALTKDDAIVLASYDIFSVRESHHAKALAPLAWDLLILDEAHYLKNLSQRTRVLYGRSGATSGVQANAERVLLLTGTPTPNHIGELYQHMRTLWPQTLNHPQRVANGKPSLMSEDEFLERVCGWKMSQFGRQITGSTEAGRQLVRTRVGPFVRRVTKAEALPELPPVIIQDVPLAVHPLQVFDALPIEVRALERQLYSASDDDLAHALARVPRHADDDEQTPLSTLRRQLGEQKVRGTVDWVIERLDCGVRKLALFGWHVRALQSLHHLLAQYEPVLITGATTSQDRHTQIERFQNRPQCRVFIGQILAAGTAITLTAASEAVIFEPSWVPGENQQAIDRLHRIGQPSSVLATYLYLPGTLDHRVIQIMRRKQRHITGVFTHAD